MVSNTVKLSEEAGQGHDSVRDEQHRIPPQWVSPIIGTHPQGEKERRTKWMLKVEHSSTHHRARSLRIANGRRRVRKDLLAQRFNRKIALRSRALEDADIYEHNG